MSLPSTEDEPAKEPLYTRIAFFVLFLLGVRPGREDALQEAELGADGRPLRVPARMPLLFVRDRKSTRLNSSHRH